MKQKKFCCLPLVLTVVLAWLNRSSAIGHESALARTNALTVEAIIQIALTNNPEIRILLADIAAAKGEVTVARTWQNPEVSVAPGVDHFRSPSDNQFHADFDWQQTLEWPGKRELRRAVAEKNVTLRQLGLAGFQTQLAIQVRGACFNLLMARETMVLREQGVALAQSFVDAANRRAGGGYAPAFEVTKAEVEVVAARKNLREAQARRDTARACLNALMGRDPQAPLDVSAMPVGADNLPEPAILVERALTQNPAVKVAEAEVERAGLSLRSVRKSRLPDFRTGPTVEYTRDEQIVGWGVSLPLPFWDTKKGEIVTATAEQAKARAEVERLRSEIRRDIIIATQNLAAAKESFEFYTPELREKLKVALDAATKGYEEGHTPLLLYLEAQRTYFDTQAGYLETRQKIAEACAQLESAAGIMFDPFSRSSSLETN